MNKTTYLSNSDVKDFIQWLSANLDTFEVDLNIKSSRFVPGGIGQKCRGFNAILAQYVWRTEGTKTGDWHETSIVLDKLSRRLRDAIDLGTDKDALSACTDVLRWGGNRDYGKGAYPFLKDQANLRAYLKTAGQTLALNSADTDRLSAIQDMNSMLTKVHAFYARDGLPIYDSRVAAAIAALIELWRFRTGKTHTALPKVLRFPALTKNRDVGMLFPTCRAPGKLHYGQANIAAEWSGCKIRLGWLLQGIVDERSQMQDLPALDFSQESALSNPMRAFEAVLFMIGYDLRSIRL